MISNHRDSLRIGPETLFCRSVVALGHAWAAGNGNFKINLLRVIANATLRFAELENLVFLSMLTSKYKIDVKSEPQFAHETFDQRRERVLQYFVGITTT